MKKVLLLLISLLASQIAVFAYQTVLVDFPQNQGWHSVYYGTSPNEAILQYVPIGDTYENWHKSVIFHSYKNLTWTNSSAQLMDKLTQQMELQNPTQMYRYLKYSEEDSLATRCIQKNTNIGTQCEIFRATQSHEGLITMHYVNKNTADFKNSYSMWLQIIKDVRIYYSYYMDDRILDKATSFEL